MGNSLFGMKEESRERFLRDPANFLQRNMILLFAVIEIGDVYLKCSFLFHIVE